MPELPEVETVRRGLEPTMQGAVMERVELRRPDLRFPFPDNMAARLQGTTVNSLSRRAKYLMINFDNGLVLVCHLGMSGSFRTHNAHMVQLYHEHTKLEAHDHVVFHIKQANGDQAQIIYNDPRRFGFMFMGETHLIHEHPHLSGLGLEPTGNQLSGDALALMLNAKKTTLKSALLNQKLIAGLGNIYVCEALWRSGLSPLRQAGTLTRKKGTATARCHALAGHIREVIADAIKAGGSSLRDHMQTDGTLGYFQHSFAVYDQEGAPCKKTSCDGTIKRIVQSGRSTFYCSTCQR
ncbi:bifunctional DNA-formamidopyrimidine glycosylase/DNA-(apurinic or apyrimidinic site) lyase [Ahrensia marina]|uniref:Formamidopyrimidine-DNA glycosylase n=1 Tax=Ahrensia marina TaxID=1514904 RepID=A0A0M9GNC4_9HYPH|nr:bifunctional DNA-formamidopyrimidine glycosylase/DNA-(apurinic or apyrimidinic site) lyase [Ahrensia marina]KPB01947.1 5-hydroxymethyluracil DNA glycosylase [Ahrensia marina]